MGAVPCKDLRPMRPLSSRIHPAWTREHSAQNGPPCGQLSAHSQPIAGWGAESSAQARHALHLATSLRQ